MNDLRGRIRHAFYYASGGYAVLEVVVATALIVTVLVPLSGMAIYPFTVNQNEPHLVALMLGRHTMEEALHARSYESQTIRLEQGRWRVHKTITQAGNQITIRVRVFRRHRPKPLVELMTVRLRP